MRTLSTHSTSLKRRLRAAAASASVALIAALAPATTLASTVAAGQQHTCAVQAGGTVVCWGSNSDGQLGNGTSTDSPSPVTVTGLSGVVEVSAGQLHSCALVASGTVRCWGAGTLGALGDGKAISSTKPVDVAGVSGAVALSTSGFTSCALTSAGSIFCWGQYVGDTNLGMPNSAPSAVLLSGASQATDVSVGDGEVCAISPTDTDCWSFQNDLGNGTANFADAPIPLAASDDLQQTTGGLFDGCGLLASGQVSCHGYNNYGQLGNGTTGNLMGNDRMPRGQSLALGITDARAISTFGQGNCALLTSGQVSCWGSVRGGLGNWSGSPNDILATPQPVAGLEKVVGIASAGSHACAVDQLGALRCWGSNQFGEIGNGTKVPAKCPTLVNGVTVATSARDRVTPIRRGEADRTAPTPVPGTTPLPTTPLTIPCNATTPTTPGGSTPGGTTPRGTELAPGMTPTTPIVPALLLSRGWLTLTGVRVPQRWAGSCPKRATIKVRASGKSTTKTLTVTSPTTGTCEVSGAIRLRGRLARASTVVVVIRPRGLAAFTQRVTGA